MYTQKNYRAMTENLKEQVQFIWLFRTAWIEQLMLAAFITCVVTAVLLMLSGCGSVGTITRFADGTISETHAFTFGSTAAVSDFKDSIKTPNKSGRSISFGTGNTDVNVEALEQSNQLLGTLVGAAVKAAK